MSWRVNGWAWAMGFCAGAAVASWLTLSCTVGHTQSPEVAAAIQQAAQRHGVSEARLRCLAYRESRYLPWAYNRAGPYHGAFQFDGATWASGAARAGWAGASPYDIWAAADVTAYLIAHGEGFRWPPLRWC